MKLLIATDHRYYRLPEGVFDTFCFDQEFFSDYRKVFEEVDVISRIQTVTQLKAGSRSDGNGVVFLDVPDLHGAQWMLRSGQICGPVVNQAVAGAAAVIVRVPSQLGWLATRQAERLGKPFMVEVIGDPYDAVTAVKNNLAYRLVAWNSARQVKAMVKNAAAVSYVNRVHLPQAYPVSPGTPFDFISSIRLDPKDVCLPRQDWPPRDNFRLVLVAAMYPRKRHTDLITVCEALTRQGVNVEVHFAGDGPLRAELTEQARACGMQDRVIFHGQLVGLGTINHLLDSCDLFVLPSASEGLPRAVLEAMSRGLPAIGTNIPGANELFRPEDLFPVGDIRALAALITAVAGDGQRLAAMSVHSANKAREYTSDVLTPKRLRLYQHLRDQASAGGSKAR